MAETFLERIVVATRARLAERMAVRSLDEVRAEAERQPPALDFAAALRPTDGGINVIAEFKRASPSKGVLNADANPAKYARIYANKGAAAISVLTEEDHFRGNITDLRAVKTAPAVIERQVPVLRKDFITDPYQIIEARAAGADSYLLIVALLDDAKLAAFIQFGRELGMEPLVEVHDAEEAKRAVAIGARVIGVNARDLRTFTVDTTILRDIRPLIPQDRIVVAESGIRWMADALRMRQYGAHALLIGENLMRDDGTPNIARFNRLPSVVMMFAPQATPRIKLCGMRTPADALAAHAAGADLIGLVFASGKRQVSVAQAREIVAALPENAVTVGVFVAEQREQFPHIQETVAASGVTVAQIHAAASIMLQTENNEKAQLERLHEVAHGLSYQAMGVPTIVSLPNGSRAYGDIVTPKQGLPLIDSAPPGVWGGSGEVGDWQYAAEMAKQYPILLAGGLNPANVGEAIRVVQPWGVDVSSGIEGADGQKDPARMRAFVEAVRAATGTVEHEGHERR